MCGGVVRYILYFFLRLARLLLTVTRHHTGIRLTPAPQVRYRSVLGSHMPLKHDEPPTTYQPRGQFGLTYIVIRLRSKATLEEVRYSAHICTRCSRALLAVTSSSNADGSLTEQTTDTSHRGAVRDVVGSAVTETRANIGLLEYSVQCSLCSARVRPHRGEARVPPSHTPDGITRAQCTPQ